MGEYQWAGMWCAADIGMSRGDCAATYAGIVINACTCTCTQVQWRFGGKICVTGCKRPVGADGHGATAISVRGVGSGVYTGSCAYLSRAYCLQLCESGDYTYVAIAVYKGGCG